MYFSENNGMVFDLTLHLKEFPLIKLWIKPDSKHPQAIPFLFLIEAFLLNVSVLIRPIHQHSNIPHWKILSSGILSPAGLDWNNCVQSCRKIGHEIDLAFSLRRNLVRNLKLSFGQKIVRRFHPTGGRGIHSFQGGILRPLSTFRRFLIITSVLRPGMVAGLAIVSMCTG